MSENLIIFFGIFNILTVCPVYVRKNSTHERYIVEGSRLNIQQFFLPGFLYTDKSLGLRLSTLFSMDYWDQAFLPRWLVQMGWSAHDNALRGKITGKSVLFFYLNRRASFKLSTGGCTLRSSDWVDPPNAPPFFSYRIISKLFSPKFGVREEFTNVETNRNAVGAA